MVSLFGAAIMGALSAAPSAVAGSVSPLGLGAGGLAGYELQSAQVSFATPETGWLAVTGTRPAASSELVAWVLGTRDGGASWHPEWAGEGVGVQLDAVSATSAVLSVQGNFDCSAGMDPPSCKTTLVATSDGGRSWAPLGAASRVITSFSLANRSTGLAAVVPRPCPDNLALRPTPCSGAVARTTDGGHKWSTVLRVPDPVIAVDATAPTWWAVEDLPGFYQGSLVVWTSTDSGLKWSRRGQLPHLSLLTARATATLVARGDQVWLSLFDIDSCAMHGCSTVEAWHSGDGGRSWSEDTPQAAAPPGVGQFCGADNLSLGLGGHLRPYLAFDYGAGCTNPEVQVFSWSHGQWRFVSAISGPYGFGPMTWPTEREGFVSTNQAVARTDDGGRHWVQVWPPEAPTGPLAPLSPELLIGAKDLVDQGVVLASHDAGAKWSVLATLPGDVLYLAFPNKASGYAAVCDGASGSVYLEVSKDGGRTWHQRSRLPVEALPSPAGEDLSGLWFDRSGDGLALVTRGDPACSTGGVGPAVLWATSDGGRSWAKAGRVPVVVSLSTASFAPSGVRTSRGPNWVGWSEGGQAHPELTSNSGRTWQADRRAPLLNGVQLVAPKVIVGWSTTTSGEAVLWYSSDGGSTWEHRALPENGWRSPGPAELSFVNATDGWWVLSGTSGDIWSTADGGRHWRLVFSP